MRTSPLSIANQNPPMKKLLCLLTLLALVSPAFSKPVRIMVFGDSNSWGFEPNPNPPSVRFPLESRWPGVLQNELGSDYEVIVEALNGRTTDASDNQLPGAGVDGSAYLPAAINSQHPIDLVVIMLGTNDLKAAYNRTPYRIALGAGRLIDICNTIGGGIGSAYPSPKVLLICPAALNPVIEKGPVFGEMFAGGLEKSKQLSKLYEGVAQLGGAAFFDANTVISTDGNGGLHLSADAQKKLGTAVAAKVREIVK
jgi:lysophospholipase L1-like esterase